MNEKNDMNVLIKKAQEMINNNQIPKEVSQIIQNMPQTKNNNNNNESSINLNNNIDIVKMLNMINAINKQTTDDNMSKLLFALKPYLRNEKKEKIDDYIKLIKMGKIAQVVENLNQTTDN
ncbi:MAG: hypothetical protein IKG14_00020 [Clostridia bacterium]|nr:hypothetical protein [Clostridia bacterium]